MEVYNSFMFVFLMTGIRAEYNCSYGLSTPITVTHFGTSITSPGFPRSYPNSHRCNVSLVTVHADHVLHVEVVFMQLDNWNNTCLDYVIAYDGVNNGSNVLHRWCGSDNKIVSTSGTSLVLEFNTDETLTDVGFAVIVWSEPHMTLSCDMGRHLIVSNVPRHISTPDVITKTGKQHHCVYHLQTEKPNDVITLTLLAWSALEPIYTMQIFDGPNTESPLLSRSRNNRPFADLTSSGSHLTIRFFINRTELTEVGWNPSGTIRAVSVTPPASCENVLPREVTSLPSYLAFPLIFDASGIPCPLKIISRDFKQTLRVDVTELSTDEESGNLLNVTEGSLIGGAIPYTSRDNITTYRSGGPVVYVQANSSMLDGHILRLRVLAQDRIHNGAIIHRNAVNSSTSSDIVMEHLPSNAYVVHNITADSDDNVVQIRMNARHHDNHPENTTLVEFFDGDPRNRTLLKTWYPGSDVSTTIRSTVRQLSFVVHTGEEEPRLSLTGHYFSLKEGSMCGPGWTDVPAKATENRFITSPNFPGNYSVNNDCIWRIAAPRINYVVVAEVTGSDLPDDCSDLVYVVYGIYPTDRTVGRICGQDRKSFRSTGPTLLLHFISNSDGNRAGFNISYTTEHVTGGRRTKGGPPVGIIAGACIALSVVAGVIYVIVHENRKRHKRAKREREDY